MENVLSRPSNSLNAALHENGVYLELFWFGFLHIWTEYGEILSPYLSLFSPNSGKCGPE